MIRSKKTGEPDTSFLPESLREELVKLGGVDVLVGIPSFNNATTIGHVVRAVHAGFARYFPRARTLVLNADGGSTDGTPEVVKAAEVGERRLILARHPLRPVHRLTTPYHGIPGKGSALRTVFGAAVLLGAKACAVVDADLRSITPEWVDWLLSPVLREGFDFVAPLYRRHKFDGTITNSLVYPVTRALYGKRIRQPIGGDFGFSQALARFWLTQDVWDSHVARFGIDIWMTTTALAQGFKVCQSFLGAKIHDVKDPGLDLTAMLVHVAGALFDLMETYETRWRGLRDSESTPTFGFPYAVAVEPVHVNVERMLRIFTSGLRDLRDVWAQVLHPDTLRELTLLKAEDPQSFRFPASLWARVTYDMAVAYHHKVIHREHLLRSLTPLYLGRTASFVLETAQADAEEVEALLEAVCLEFEKQKPYLEQRWGTPPGGIP